TPEQQRRDTIGGQDRREGRHAPTRRGVSRGRLASGRWEMSRLRRDGQADPRTRSATRGSASPHEALSQGCDIRSPEWAVGLLSGPPPLNDRNDPDRARRSVHVRTRRAHVSQRRSPLVVLGASGDLIMPRVWSQSYVDTITIALR